MKKSIIQLHEQHRIEQSEIDFLLYEIEFLEHLLKNKQEVHELSSENALKFQAEFLVLKSRLEKINTEVSNSEESMRILMDENLVEADEEIMQDQEYLMDSVNELKLEFRSIKQSFYGLFMKQGVVSSMSVK